MGQRHSDRLPIVLLVILLLVLVLGTVASLIPFCVIIGHGYSGQHHQVQRILAVIERARVASDTSLLAGLQAPLADLGMSGVLPMQRLDLLINPVHQWQSKTEQVSTGPICMHPASTSPG